jgi:hypothetical protein
MYPSTAHVVTWIGEPPTFDDDVRLVWSAIVERGLVEDVAIAAAVADGLFRRDIAAAGPSSDAGIFRRLYGREARRLLDGLDGTRIGIEEAPAWVR